MHRGHLRRLHTALIYLCYLYQTQLGRPVHAQRLWLGLLQPPRRKHLGSGLMGRWVVVGRGEP